MMLGRAAPVLVPLVAQVALIGVGVRQVTGRRVVHDGLGRLAEGGDHSLDQEKDEEKAQAGEMLAPVTPGCNVGDDSGREPYIMATTKAHARSCRESPSTFRIHVQRGNLGNSSHHLQDGPWARRPASQEMGSRRRIRNGTRRRQICLLGEPVRRRPNRRTALHTDRTDRYGRKSLLGHV